MHVVVSKKDLLRVLGRCQGVADKKSTMPVLGNVLLEVASPNELRLAATDLFVSVSGKIPAKVENGGSIALGARELFERVRMMPDGQVALQVTGTQAVIRAIGSSHRLGSRRSSVQNARHSAPQAQRYGLEHSRSPLLKAGTKRAIRRGVGDHRRVTSR